jgi:5-methylcytosine-specific restriction protein A
MTGDVPEKVDFEKALADWFRDAEKEENVFVDIRADDLHARVGDYPGPFHRMATCCEVMYENYLPAIDRILQFPPKGKGASMEIRYALPRVKAPDTGTPQVKSFTVKCEYCHGTGRDVRNLNAQQKVCPASGCGVEKPGLHSLPGKLENYGPCKKCKGSGVKPGSAAKNPPAANRYAPCPDCNGTGLTKTE